MASRRHTWHTWHTKGSLKVAKATRDPAGDFVRDARHDQEFPHTSSRQTVSRYLNSYQVRACPEAIDAFRTVWQRFLRWQKRAAKNPWEN